jgi:hypothetical protein
MHSAELGFGAAQETGEGVLGERVGYGGDGAEGGGRVGAEGDGDGVALAGILFTPVPVIEGAAAVREPAHDQLVATEQLHAVDAEVLSRLAGPARDDQGPGDQRRRVTGPAGLYRQGAQVHVIALVHALVRRGIAYQLRAHVQHLLQQRCLVPGIAQALRRIRLAQVGEQFADLAQGFDVLRAHAQGHALLGAEQVRQQGDVVAAGVLEQQRRAAGAQGAVGDLGDLEVRVHLGADAPEFTALLEPGNEFAEVAVAAGHGAVAREPATSSSWTGRTRRWSSCP